VADGVFAAARVEHTLNTSPFNADVSYLFARGPAREPYFVPRVGENGAEILPEYYGQWVGGLGLRAVPNGQGWSALTLKAEAAYKHPYNIGAAVGDTPEAFVQYTAGVDLQVTPLFHGRDRVLFTLEYAGENGADDLASEVRPFDSDVALRVFWEAQGFARSSIELTTAFDVRSYDLLLSATIGSQLRFIHDDLRFEVGGEYLRAGDAGESSLSGLSDNSRVSTRLRMDF
jgi:hypothetical protein